MQKVISIDIGSTYTKGVLFGLESARGRLVFRPLASSRTPTTVDHLARGFETVAAPLRAAAGHDGTPIHFSSSARGGLAIAAVGIVPELTLKTARLTALSAGGRVTSVYAYKLTRASLETLERERPDIVLLAGGTEGGNETYVRHNAAMLARSTVLPQHAAVIYAGNSAIADEVHDLLAPAGYDVRVAPNILPEVDRVEPDGAREEIRRVFLQRIVHGKGLDEVVAATGREPLPTPYAVLQLVEALRRRAPSFGEFLLVDMGGATTDVYSSTREEAQQERVIVRGLRDPEVKRTVEGDLGLRVSARSAAQSAASLIGPLMDEAERAAFADHIERIAQDPALLSESPEERHLDRILASACIHLAIARHAGTWRRVFTAAGETFIQSGKDLRAVETLIGTGGYLAASDFTPWEPLERASSPTGETLPLVPRRLAWLRDGDYLIPLLGNLVADHEEAAVETARMSLTEPGPAPACPEAGEPAKEPVSWT